MSQATLFRKGADPIGRLSVIFFVSFLSLILSLFRMQVLRHDYYLGLSERNRLRVIYLEGPRGRILDRQGVELAVNRLSFNCAVYPSEAKSTLHKSAQILSSLLKQGTPEEIEAAYRRKKPGIFNTVLLAEDISAAQAMAIEERLDSLPGFMIQTRPQREYPLGESAAHLVGFIGPINDEEEESLEPYGYRSADWLGRDGVEKSYESYVRGHSGGFQIEINSRGKMIRPLGIKEPKDGRDLTLTLDAQLQNSFQNLLKGQRGAILVMELKEGGMLAMNSSPSFDPNLFASSPGRKQVGHYLVDSQSPMMNRGLHGRYPPGSIFKVVTALAALESGKMTPSTSVNCSGALVLGRTIFHCWKETGHGPQVLTEAFAHSCNVFFYRAGMSAGIDFLMERAGKLGLGQLTGIDLPGESKGLVPSKEWKRKNFKQAWYNGETANFSIGQGYLQVTPLQALVMIAAIATDGQRLRPHVVDKIGGFKVAEKHATALGIAAGDLSAVKAGMDAVVNSETGTGRLARPSKVRAAGKTGTAQSGQDRTHAWFVGYAPSDQPKVAVVVFLENGGRGGVAAASMAKVIFDRLDEKSYL